MSLRTLIGAADADAALAIRMLVALVFLTAAAGKMRHWSLLAPVIANYRLLPAFLILPAAYALPPLEALLGLALPAGPLVPIAAPLAAALLLLFATAIAVNIARGRRQIDCGCFQDSLRQTLQWRLVARNALLAASLWLAAGPPRGGLEPHGGMSWWTALNGALGGTALFVVLQSLNALWALTAAPRAPVRATA